MITKFKTFENNSQSDNRNKILILDYSPSMYYYIDEVLKNTELYLSNKIDVYIISNQIYFFSNVDSNKLLDILHSRHMSGISFDNLIQKSLNWIADSKKQGNILIISDGFDKFDTRVVDNYVSMLIINNRNINHVYNCDIFYDNFEGNKPYLPKYDNIEDYNIAKNAEKYNL